MRKITKNKKNYSNKRKSFYYGWLIVFICALGFFFSGPGQTYNISVYLDSFIEYLGISRSMISLFYSIGTLFAGMTIFLMGKQIDRFGHRKFITIIAASFGAVCLFMSFIVHPAMLFTGFFLVRLLGQGSMMIGPSTLVPIWFEKKRGRALSFLSIGGITAAGVFPLFNTWMINNWGWKIGWIFWAIALWVVMVPLAWFLIRNRPSDMGLLPDGLNYKAGHEQENKNIQEAKKPTEKTAESVSFSLSEARRTLSFWLMIFCISIWSMIITGIIFHIVSYFKTKGLPAEAAAYTLSITAMVSLPVTLIAGYTFDRVKTRYILIAIYIFHIATLLWLINVDSIAKAIVYGFMGGIMAGFQQVALHLVWPNYFGLKHLGSIKGIVETSLIAGSAFGPLPFGFAYDYFGGYREILWAMISLSVILAIAAFFIYPPVKKSGHTVVSYEKNN